MNLQPGQPVTGLTLPALRSGFGFNIEEQLGHPVMLLWVGSCESCDKDLPAYEQLLQKYAASGLVSRVIWTAEESLQGQVPKTTLPLLVYSRSLTNAWSVEPQPAVMLINRDGLLAYTFTGRLSRNQSLADRALQQMVSEQANADSMN
ncbi:peroxiredoxin family protein [Oceanobacter mangrovi]|uniref:peroxiredoxin family protein n=1 Tax=Oceanobacter mangrovi TaxID=2862510 RepID=UPI001C8F09FF